MFPPFPGFEDWPIRVEVEFGGRTRPVLVRLECWPQSPQSVLICSFEHEPEHGEWLVMASNHHPYFAGSSHNIRTNRVVFDRETRQPQLVPTLNERRLEKLQSIVRRAFTNDNFRLMRLLELPVPDEPRTVLCGADSFWCLGWDLRDAIPFQISLSPLGLNAQQTREQLMHDWNEPDSDARFAWNWATCNDEQRRAQLCGFFGDFGELERVMTWILSGARSLWQLDSSWAWNLRPDEESGGWLWNQSDFTVEHDEPLGEWQMWLLRRFAPVWRGDWIEKHECVKQFWCRTELCEVRMNQPPTMHEQLEARLELRDWLQDKATPDEIARLFVGLAKAAEPHESKSPHFGREIFPSRRALRFSVSVRFGVC